MSRTEIYNQLRRLEDHPPVPTNQRLASLFREEAGKALSRELKALHAATALPK